MRAVVYLRVSTDEQADSGLGLEAQAHACAAWAAREGRDVVGPFADDGLSGALALDRRPGLVDAIGQLGPADVLLVAKRDRLARDPFAIAMIEAAVKSKRSRVASAAGEGTQDDEPGSVLMRRMVDAFAEYERLLIKSRTRAALAAKARRGERCGSLRFGFDLADDGVRLVPNPSEQAILLIIGDLARQGYRPRAIASYLNERSIPTKQGKGPWHHTAVAGILKRTS